MSGMKISAKSDESDRNYRLESVARPPVPKGLQLASIR